MTDSGTIYPDRFEAKIGFDRIRMQIDGLCTTEAGRRKLHAEGFSTEERVVERRLRLADELRQLLQMETGFPAEEFTETEDVTAKLPVEGSFLDTEEVHRLRSALRQTGQVVGFLLTRERAYPTLHDLVRAIDPMEEVAERIDTLLDPHGEVRDHASEELAAIRRALREHEGAAQRRLHQVLAAARSAGVVDADAAITLRDGRPTIPVAAGNKRKLPGFVVGESATGRTVYIEPVEVVEITNEQRELEYAERREIVRILQEFTASIRPDAPLVAAACDVLTTVDMIRAKARWAVEEGAVRPILSHDGRLELRAGRHPLLAQTLRQQGRTLVPLDLALDASRRILVISGPNAGGKSVCLKTVGLLQYMVQCGMLIPALENSELPLFHSLFLDMGDEQSIDDDLSTYSSHLRNMKRMIEGVSPHSLVLIDEFGTGTEPVIGGAIAEAILERLLERGTYGVITTHYANIKYFASGREGITNGAMLFDVQAIRPLFRLEQGKPGSSFAVEIARQIGLPEELIRRAGEKAGTDHIDLERQLREIARDRRYWEQKRDRIRLKDRKVEELEEHYATELGRIRSERQTILEEARTEARRLVEQANRQIEQTIRTIREAQAERTSTRAARSDLEQFGTRTEQVEQDTEHSARIAREMERIAARRRRRAERQAAEGAAGAEAAQAPRKAPVEAGSKVRIAGQTSVGEVQSVRGSKAVVAFGQILSTLPLDRLETISANEYKRQTRTPGVRVSVDVAERKLRFHSTIDVRGMRAAEALEAVQDLVDDALMVGVESVTILHGKGTGALKEEIRRYLRGVDEVESAADEREEMGGAGITVVTFKP